MERGAGLGIRDNGAGVELNGTGGESGDFGFAVKAHDHGAAGTIDFAESFGEPGDAQRVEASGGLVEEKDRRTMNECTSDGDALTHTAGEGANERGAALVKTDFAEKFFGAGRGLRNTLQLGEEDEIFFGGKLIVNHGGVGDVTGTAVSGGFRGSAGKGEFPRRGPNDARGDAE